VALKSRLFKYSNTNDVRRFAFIFNCTVHLNVKTKGPPVLLESPLYKKTNARLIRSVGFMKRTCKTAQKKLSK
jgi:hypothetical protein